MVGVVLSEWECRPTDTDSWCPSLCCRPSVAHLHIPPNGKVHLSVTQRVHQCTVLARSLTLVYLYQSLDQHSYTPICRLVHKWENAFTIDSLSWGVARNDDLSIYLNISTILYEVVSTVAYGGNALINIGPRATDPARRVARGQRGRHLRDANVARAERHGGAWGGPRSVLHK